MRSPVAAGDARQRAALCKVHQELPDAAAVELKSFILVVEAHQTFVTGCLAIGFQVIALFVEVAARQRLPRQTGDGISLFHQPAEHTRSAFGSLVDQDSPMLPVAGPLGGQFRFFQLKQLLTAALNGVLQRCFQHGTVAQFGAGEAQHLPVVREREELVACGIRPARVSH